MAWQQSGGYPYPNQQGPPPPGFYPGGPAPYPGGPASYPGGPASYPGGAPVYPGANVYPQQTPYSGATGGNMPNQYNQYEEARGSGSFAFSDKSIRLAFIRKVYSILMVQLAITAFLIALFVMSDSTSKYFLRNPMWVFVAMGVTFVTMIAMACCESVRRTPPTNFIFLFIFTLAEGFLLGVVSSTYRVSEVLLAVGICTVICLTLTIFAFQTKIDFTAIGGILLVAAVILFIFGFIMIFIQPSKPVRIVYACLGAFLFSIYLIYDTQMMMGGDHKYSISPEEYVFAALNIYVDIINIFIFILSIIGETRD